MQSSDHNRANLVGSLWMVAAMAGFAIEDMALKLAASDLPAWEVLVSFGLGGAVIFAVAAVVVLSELIAWSMPASTFGLY